MSAAVVERQQRERPEEDREQRRVAVEVVDRSVRRLVVERQAGVEPGARVVVGVDVGERIGRQVEDQHLDPEQQPEAGEDHGQHARGRVGARSGQGVGRRRRPSSLPSIGAARDPIPLDRGRADWAFRTGRRARTRCYAAPAVRIPLLLYVLALAVRLVLIAHFPDPAYPDSSYYVDVARTLAAGQGFNVDFIWIFAEVGGTHPGRPGPADPLERPLDAARVDRPGRRSSRSSATSAWAAALPFALIGVARGAAHLGASPATPARADRRGRGRRS